MEPKVGIIKRLHFGLILCDLFLDSLESIRVIKQNTDLFSNSYWFLTHAILQNVITSPPLLLVID